MRLSFPINCCPGQLARSAGAIDFIEKPFDNVVLLDAIRAALADLDKSYSEGEPSGGDPTAHRVPGAPRTAGAGRTCRGPALGGSLNQNAPPMGQIIRCSVSRRSGMFRA